MGWQRIDLNVFQGTGVVGSFDFLLQILSHSLGWMIIWIIILLCSRTSTVLLWGVDDSYFMCNFTLIFPILKVFEKYFQENIMYNFYDFQVTRNTNFIAKLIKLIHFLQGLKLQPSGSWKKKRRKKGPAELAYSLSKPRPSMWPASVSSSYSHRGPSHHKPGHLSLAAPFSPLAS